MSDVHPVRVLTPTLLTQLRAFEAVSRRGSFAAAADELFVSPSAVSHHVARLEETLGTRLLHRRRDRSVPTDVGADVAASCRTAFDAITGALGRLDAARSSSRRVTVTVAPYLSAHWLTPRLAEFWHRHPDIELRIHHAYEPVDFTTEQTDVGLVWGDGEWSGSEARRILDGSLVAVCSPAVRESLGDPLDVEAIVHRHQLLYEFDAAHWNEWLAHFGIAPGPDVRTSRIDDSHALRTAALNGHGIALFARSLLDEELAHGLLVQLGEHRVGEDHYFLVTPKGRAATPTAETFVDWILSEADA